MRRLSSPCRPSSSTCCATDNDVPLPSFARRLAHQLCTSRPSSAPLPRMPMLTSMPPPPYSDAYLPQSGPNAFHTQAYLPSAISYPSPASHAHAGAGTAAEQAEERTRDDYDRIGRIGGRTGVGWMACCAGLLLFSCTGACPSLPPVGGLLLSLPRSRPEADQNAFSECTHAACRLLLLLLLACPSPPLALRRRACNSSRAPQQPPSVSLPLPRPFRTRPSQRRSSLA